MLKTSKQDLKETLLEFDFGSEPLVFIHSSLIRFGSIEGGVTGVMEVLNEVLGIRATILMPAFTLSFGSTRYWNHSESRSEMGALTEHFRKLPGTLRSEHPFHSVSVEGPRKRDFASCFELTSFGRGSVFQKLIGDKAINLSLGTDFVGGATFLHATEEMLAVPYRFHKDFPGQVIGAASQIRPETFGMYSRIIEEEYEFINIWDSLWHEFEQNQIFEVRKIRSAPIMFSRMDRAHEHFCKLLLKDPFYSAIIKDRRKAIP